MAFNDANRRRAIEIVAQYPDPHSAILPLAHLAQDQDGWLTLDAMEEIAELSRTTPADVQGVTSFYTMYKRRPCGRLIVSVCTNVTCLVVGGPELLEHLEERYATDPDVYVEEVECLAACDDAPVLQVNYDYHGPLSGEQAEQLVEEYKAGTRTARSVSGGLARTSDGKVVG
jgi:NADH:ubiquinone oxidoreductase subunit E